MAGQKVSDEWKAWAWLVGDQMGQAWIACGGEP
jgi:hypothetical protein